MYRRNAFFIFAALIAVTAVYFPRTAQQPEEPKKYPGRNNTVLFLSNGDSGLANVVLATSYSLILEHSDLEVHYGTFKRFEKPIQRINEWAASKSAGAGTIMFHKLAGLDYAETLTEHGLGMEDIMSKHGLAGFKTLLGNIKIYLMPWTGPEYLSIYKEAITLIGQVDPALVVVDGLFMPGIDAIRALGRREVILSPNALKDTFAENQPGLAILWKYPFMGSGLSFPVPLSKIPTNIYMAVRMVYTVFRDPVVLSKRAWLRANGISNPVSFVTLYNKGITWLSAGSLDSDFPLPSGIPSNAIACGPIYLSAPLPEQDPAMATWLKRAPTILINLGSRATFTEEGATEMVKALKKVLDTSSVQVLWKFNKRTPFSDDFLSHVSQELASGRLRLEKWIKADPASLLETGDIVLFVHHGGANCYHEGVATGVPHLLLPMWADCFDYATRAEHLEIGVWGNEKAAPYWHSDELDVAFSRVLGNGTEAASIRENAAALGNKIRKNPGRSVAAAEIARLARLGRF